MISLNCLFLRCFKEGEQNAQLQVVVFQAVMHSLIIQLTPGQMLWHGRLKNPKSWKKVIEE
jgi:hypothetical protein